MKISDIMTRDVCIAAAEETVREAAKKMAEIDAGMLPVSENDRLVGMVTDRDIVIRGVAAGKGPDVKIRDVMTQDVKYCYEDQDTEEVASNMADQQVRRLPVLDHNKRLVGIVSLADLAANQESEVCGMALRGISQPGGAHCQSEGSHRAA